MIYSHSRLQKFIDCPWAFYKHYVMEQEEPPSEPLAFGSVVHLAANSVIANGAGKEEALLDALADAPLRVDIKEARRQLDIALSLYNAYTANKPAWKSEEHFQLPLDPNDPLSPELQGYLDLHVYAEDDPEHLLLDWKTGRRFYPHDETQQLRLYAWAIREIYGAERVKAGLHFLRLKKKSFTTYDYDAMEAARLWALNLAREIENLLVSLTMGETPKEVFSPTPGPKVCKNCGLADAVCGQEPAGKPAGSFPAVSAAPSSLTEAEELAREIVRLEGISGAMKEMLKEWVRSKGPVPVGDKEWNFYPSTTWSFSPDQMKALARAIADEGKNPWEFLTMGSSQIKKLGWEEERLREFGTLKTSETFRYAKSEDAKKSEGKGSRNKKSGKDAA